MPFLKQRTGQTGTLSCSFLYYYMIGGKWIGSLYERVRINEGSWNIGPIRHMAATHKHRSRLLLYAEEII
jgi:hypothetical protein